MTDKLYHTIPLQPHLRKYITKLGPLAKEKEPYPIGEDTLLGKQLMLILKDKRANKQVTSPTRVDIKVVLSEFILDHKPTRDDLRQLEGFIDKLFKDCLITWIQSSDLAGVKPFESTKSYLTYLGIAPSEYSHEAAYKVWQRWKSKGHRVK